MSLLPVGAIPVVGGYDINNSLRFRSSATAFLSRTPVSAGSRTTWTWSAWVKRGSLGTEQFLFTGGDSNFNDNYIRFNADNTLNFQNFNGSANAGDLGTSRVFRDPSAWYHIVAVWNTTTATAADRMQLWINGVRETAFNSNNNPVQNQQSFNINNNIIHNIARKANGATAYFDGYMTEINFISGQALSASSFGETNATTGVWQPKAYTGLYGANGFYLKFSDATIGTPTLINTATAVQNTNSTTITVNVPAGTTNNDLMILVATVGSISSTWTTPSGWTLWGNNAGRTVFYRTASSEPASYTLTQSVSITSSACILTYRNAAIDVFGTYSANASPSVAPSITTTAPNAVVFDYVAGRTNASQTYTTPTNFTPLLSDSDATAPSYAVFSRVQATAGATGTATTTPSSGSAMSVQFSIKPASTNLGKDFSGNNNLWATNNISITSGITYDAMIDSPTLTSATVSNYCVMNPLDNGNTLSDGNLNVAGAVDRLTRSTFGMSSGKWYCEVFISSVGTSCHIGIATAASSSTIYLGGDAFGWSYGQDGRKWNNLTGSTYGASYTTNDIIGIAFDADTGSLTFYKNGTTQGVAFTGLTSGAYFFAVSASSPTVVFNFGQRPFTYTPPTGFNRVNTFNLPTSTIVKGNSFMDATLYTGTGASRSVTNAAGFRPDFVWVKGRSGATDHALYDAVRGTTNDLVSNSDAAATTQAQGLTAFNSNGFTVGTLAKLNFNTDTYVAWQWQAGSSTVTNTSGTISAQVRANTTTGFSIVTYTGNGSATASVGHGLGVAPKVVIIKARSTIGNWAFYTSAVDGSWDILNLNTTATKSDSSAAAPTSSVFNLITAGNWNTNAVTYVAYCWAEIAGFSAFGSYTGNGSTNGSFVYTGFRPAFILIKPSSATNTNWLLLDSKRLGYNVVSNTLFANGADNENTAVVVLDILSNGFKIRGTSSSANTNGATIIYAAFAENPFKNALAR